MPETKNIYTALLAFQKEMGPVHKDGRGNYGSYPTLDGVIEAVGEKLNDQGIVYTQPLVMIDGEQHIKTMLVHAESQSSVDSFYKVVCKDPSDPQKVGGGITYGRRYQLLALLGLAPEDDDGNAASQPARSPQPASHPATRPTQNATECPKCGGEMWDNREKKTNPKAPDFKCKDRDCDGVIWPPKPEDMERTQSATEYFGEFDGQKTTLF
jgi:hypothetical protein